MFPLIDNSINFLLSKYFFNWAKYSYIFSGAQILLYAYKVFLRDSTKVLKDCKLLKDLFKNENLIFFKAISCIFLIDYQILKNI